MQLLEFQLSLTKISPSEYISNGGNMPYLMSRLCKAHFNTLDIFLRGKDNKIVLIQLLYYVGVVDKREAYNIGYIQTK